MRKGYKHSEDAIRKIKEARARQVITEETKRKISLAHKGRHLSPTTEFRKGHPKYGNGGFKKGHKAFGGFDTRFKKGQHISPNTEFKKGLIPWNTSKHWSEENRKKMREAALKRIFPTKDTLIEVKLQEGLKKISIPFKTHKVLLNICQCDIFIEPNIVIFVDGCYWHGCEQCYDRNKMSNWIKSRKVADIVITEKLQKEGFKVLRFWEHDINENFEDKILDEIIFAVNETNKIAGGIE